MPLRTPSLDDLSALAELGRDTFVETFGDLYKSEDLQAFLTEVYSEKAVEEELNNPDLHFQILTQGDELIGYAKIGPVHAPAENPAPGAMELWQLYVRQKYLGQGLGKKLMAWAEEQFAAHNATEIYISVFSENPRAIRFYENHGYRKVGEYGFPVGDQIDLEWIMCKTSGAHA